MTSNAAMLMAALVLSGTVLAQSTGPSAGGAPEAGQGANLTTTGQALTSSRKTDGSGPVERAQRPARPDAAGNTVGVSRPKPDRRLDHYP